MLAAAGIVVTEISTPISAPDLAVERLSMPAAPAQTATMNANASGLEMLFASAWSSMSKASGTMSAPSKMQRGEHGGADREREADDERERRAARELGRAAGRPRRTRPATGPNSGPTTIAPTTRIGDVEEDPDRGDDRGQHHVEQEDAPTARRSRWCAGRAPPRSTASAGEPGACSTAASAKSEIVSVGLIEIDPSWWMPSSRDRR